MLLHHQNMATNNETLLKHHVTTIVLNVGAKLTMDHALVFEVDTHYFEIQFNDKTHMYTCVDPYVDLTKTLFLQKCSNLDYFL